MAVKKKARKKVAKKKTSRKKAVGSGLKKYANYIKADPTVKSATKKLKELEKKTAAEKRRLASAKKKRAVKFRKLKR
jgi:hypothetical protein